MVRWCCLVLVFAVSGCLCSSREEKLKKAEEQGNLLVAAKAKLAKGAGEALKKEGSEAAETVTEGAGEVVKAVGKGFEKSLRDVKLMVTGDLEAKGVKATRAARAADGANPHVVSVYLTLDRPFTGSLLLLSKGRDGQETGRATAKLEEKEATGKYLDFEFDPRTPLLTADHFELK
jgi:hypothetical protein